jgi:hypothetical protein
MRVVVFAFTVLLMMASSAAAQSVEPDLVKLREILNLSASTLIVPSTSSLPANSPMRVFITVGPNQKVQRGITKPLMDNFHILRNDRFSSWHVSGPLSLSLSYAFTSAEC